MTAYPHDKRPFFDARMMIHISLVVILFGLGANLLRVGDTFASTPAWKYFPEIASENAWAFILMVTAAIGATGIHPAARWIKTASVLVLATMHGTLALLFYRGNPMGGATIVFLTIAAQGYYLAWRQV